MFNFEVINIIAMETIRIQFQPKLKEKILKLLNSFSEVEVQIIFEDAAFEENRKRVQESYEKLMNGTETFYTIEEASESLDKTISEYEN